MRRAAPAAVGSTMGQSSRCELGLDKPLHYRGNAPAGRTSPATREDGGRSGGIPRAGRYARKADGNANSSSSPRPGRKA